MRHSNEPLDESEAIQALRAELRRLTDAQQALILTERFSTFT